MQHEKYAILSHDELFKVFIDFFILPDRFQVNHIPVYSFHDIIAGPSSLCNIYWSGTPMACIMDAA